MSRASNVSTKLAAQLSLGAVITSTRRAAKPKRGRPAGRKTTSHDKRPSFAKDIPQHVTLRTVPGAPNLAREWLMSTIRGCIRESHKATFRIVEFNVLGNHLHLICEASSPDALARGVNGFEVRLVRRLNKKLARKGKLFATRYHARALTSPRDVKNTLRYVLCNRKHHAAAGIRFDKFWVDPFSSAPWFSGWEKPVLRRYREDAPKPTADASVWLLKTGWKQIHGPLRFDERPA